PAERGRGARRRQPGPAARDRRTGQRAAPAPPRPRRARRARPRRRGPAGRRCMMTPAEELRYLILALQREGNRLLAAGLRALELTPSQAETLRVLADHQPLTLTGLGELLVCETGDNPSRLVDRLVK